MTASTHERTIARALFTYTAVKSGGSQAAWMTVLRMGFLLVCGGVSGSIRPGTPGGSHPADRVR